MGFADFLKSPQRYMYNAGDVNWEWTNRDRIVIGSVLATLAVSAMVLTGSSKADSQPEDVPPVHPVVVVENEKN